MESEKVVPMVVPMVVGVDVRPAEMDYTLEVNVTQSEPDYLAIFLENGGQINGAAVQWETDFAMSHSDATVFEALDHQEIKRLSIPIPAANVLGERVVVDREGNEKVVAYMMNSTRCNASTSRMGPAINGTLVSSVSGQGSEHLYNILKHATRGHSQMGLVYASWLAHGATVGFSDAVVVGIDRKSKERRVVDVEFGSAHVDAGYKQILKGAAEIVKKYVSVGLMMRQHMPYPPSPMLTKTVFKNTVGIDAQGYSLLHDILDRKNQFSMATLESLFNVTIANVLGQSDQKISDFESSTALPGLAAASCANIVAAATNLIVTFLTAYRADGRNVVSIAGADFSAAESWLHQVPRTPGDGNDCDGSALQAINLLQSAVGITPEEEAEFNTLRSVKNVVCPFYQLAMTVVGATAAEATSADAGTTHVAGHAIGIMLPTINMLNAMSNAMPKEIGSTKQTVCSPEMCSKVQELRFNCLFPPQKLKGMTQKDRDDLTSWHVAKNLVSLKPMALEGTTPASPDLFVDDTVERTKAEAMSRKDDVALAKASPNVFRSIKVLHVGGAASGSTHRFYRDLVEMTFARSNPLYSDPALRSMNAAASQFVVVRNTVEDQIKAAGATPKDLHTDNYMLVPLVSVNNQHGRVLDIASKEAEKDVLPPRQPVPMQLSDLQSENVRQSYAAILQLKDEWAQTSECHLGKNCPDDVHCVAYECAFSTLINNPKGVQHFVKTIKSVATGGCVDISEVKDLAVDVDRKQRGHYVSINATVPVSV